MSLRQMAGLVKNWSGEFRSAGDPFSEIENAWDAVAGPEVAQNARPVRLRDGELMVVTSSSSWSQQLGLLAPRIIQQLADRVPAAPIAGLRFRVGTIAPRRAPPGRRTRRSALRHCVECGVSVEGDAQRCAPCEGADTERRKLALERLLYETPWLPFIRLAAEIPGLTRDEYERIRASLLDRWWELLGRSARSGKLRPDGLERRLAASYVILHSRLDANRITPAIVQNLLGPHLWELLSGAEGLTTLANLEK